MTKRACLLTLMTCMCVASCRATLAPNAAHLPAPCPAVQLDISAWTAIDRHDFAFRVPPEFRPVPVQGIDSWVEEFATRDSTQTVSFDYGRFSDDLHRDPGMYSEYRSCTEAIGGREARVVVVRLRNTSYPRQDGTYAAAATWRDVRNGNHLILLAWTPNPANLERLLVMLRTVRFPKSDSPLRPVRPDRVQALPSNDR